MPDLNLPASELDLDLPAFELDTSIVSNVDPSRSRMVLDGSDPNPDVNFVMDFLGVRNEQSGLDPDPDLDPKPDGDVVMGNLEMGLYGWVEESGLDPDPDEEPNKDVVMGDLELGLFGRVENSGLKPDPNEGGDGDVMDDLELGFRVKQSGLDPYPDVMGNLEMGLSYRVEQSGLNPYRNWGLGCETGLVEQSGPDPHQNWGLGLETGWLEQSGPDPNPNWGLGFEAGLVEQSGPDPNPNWGLGFETGLVEQSGPDPHQNWGLGLETGLLEQSGPDPNPNWGLGYEAGLVEQSGPDPDPNFDLGFETGLVELPSWSDDGDGHRVVFGNCGCEFFESFRGSGSVPEADYSETLVEHDLFIGGVDVGLDSGEIRSQEMDGFSFWNENVDLNNYRFFELEIIGGLVVDQGDSMFVEGEADVDVSGEVIGGEINEMLGNLAWQVFLPMAIHILAVIFGSGGHEYYYVGYMENEDYTLEEYERLFEQFGEDANVLPGRPPASRAVVENLDSVLISEEDVENGNAICAVCKDGMNVGEMVKQLPCSHRYHGDCIMPWLEIRNTCPVCRFELPTDDPDYELWRRGLLEVQQ